MKVPANLPAERLIVEYLSRVTVAGLHYLPKGRRIAFVGSTRNRIERETGPAAKADPARVREVLARLGDPEDLVRAERARLDAERIRLHSRDKAAGEAEAAEISAPLQHRRINSRWRPATRARPQDRPPGEGAAREDKPKGRLGGLLGGRLSRPPTQPGVQTPAGAAAPSPDSAAGPPAGGMTGPAPGTAAPAAAGGVLGGAAPQGQGGTAQQASGGAGTQVPGGTPLRAPGDGTRAPGPAGAPPPTHDGAAPPTHDGAAPPTQDGAAPPTQDGDQVAGGAAARAPGRAGAQAPRVDETQPLRSTGTQPLMAPGSQAPGGTRALAPVPEGSRPAPRQPADGVTPAPGTSRAASAVPSDPLAPADGSAAPADGSAAPADGSAPPAREPLTLRGAATTLGRGATELAWDAAALFRQWPLESVVVVLLGLGGLILPVLFWPVGGLVALWSRVWDVRDKWVALLGPPVITLLGTLVIALIMGGRGDAAVAYWHALRLGWGYLLRAGSVLCAAYLVLRVRQGPRQRVPPWRR